MVLIMALSISSCGQVLITDPMRIMRRMLKIPRACLVHLVCSVCLVFWLNENDQINKTNQIN